MRNANPQRSVYPLWATVTLLALGLTGCGQRPAEQAAAPEPGERVAGERQEIQDEETARVVGEAGLPAGFTYGGRRWLAADVHWIEPEERTGAPAGAERLLGQIGDFVPVTNLSVQDHQIYRRSGLDEAVTDNIFLKAEASPAAAGEGAAEGGEVAEPGRTPTVETPGRPGGETAVGEGTGRRTVFVEYDATENLVETMELSQVLGTTGLPQTVQHDGRTWTAREIQVYDADVFDELKPVTDQVEGHTAFMGKARDALFLQGEMRATTERAEGPEAAAGPIFIRYEEGEADAAETGATPGGR